MTNVFEGTPDERQSASETEKLSRFRPRYRALSQPEKDHHDEIKDAFSVVEKCIDRLPNGRYKALAMTTLENSCMWAIKSLTDNR